MAAYIEPPAPCFGLPFIRLADDVGDGSGNNNAIGDYSIATGTPTKFKITAQPGEELLVHRIIVHIEDAGAMKADGYGALPALANGVTVCKCAASGVAIHDLLDRDEIKSNADWGHQCYDVTILNFGAGTNETLYARWTITQTGVPLILYEGQSLVFGIADDDLTGLIDHHFSVQGTRNAVVV